MFGSLCGSRGGRGTLSFNSSHVPKISRMQQTASISEGTNFDGTFDTIIRDDVGAIANSGGFITPVGFNRVRHTMFSNITTFNAGNNMLIALQQNSKLAPVQTIQSTIVGGALADYTETYLMSQMITTLPGDTWGLRLSVGSNNWSGQVSSNVRMFSWWQAEWFSE